MKALTTSSSCRIVPPSSSRPTRNSRWSGPIRMWWMPGGDELAHDRDDALPRAGEVVEAVCVPGRGWPATSIASPFVEVDERLVRGIVRKHPRRDRRRGPGCRRGHSARALGSTADRAAARPPPSDAREHRPSVGAEVQPVGDERRDARGCGLRKSGSSSRSGGSTSGRGRRQRWATSDTSRVRPSIGRRDT